MLARDRLLELSEQLDTLLNERPVQLSKARRINRQIVAAAEEEAVIRKTIQDLARYGQPSIRTMRYLVALEKDRAGGETPDAA